jgi:hypothetical protein
MACRKLRSAWQGALIASVIVAASAANAQDIVVSFEFRDPRLAQAEDNSAQTEQTVAQELARLLGGEFKYWSFCSSVGCRGEYHMTIWPESGTSSDWDVTLELAYPARLGRKESWRSILFPYGYLPAKFGVRNPHGGAQWKAAIGQQFSAIMVREHRAEILQGLRNVPIGETMVLDGTTNGGRRNIIPALLTPIRPEAAQLTEARFKLLFQSDEGPLHLHAKSAPAIRSPGAATARPTIRAVVFGVLEPPGEGLVVIDRLKNTLRGEGFLLLDEAIRFDPALQAP